jgi:hypothetical protein
LFESKEALFNVMINQASGTIAYPINEREWDMRLKGYAENILSVLNKHNQLAQLFMMYPPTSSNYKQHFNNLFDSLHSSFRFRTRTCEYAG